VRFQLGALGIQAVVLDIEGTTTPITFVSDVLFPFARRALPAYVREHLDAPDLREPLGLLHEGWAEDMARGERPPPWCDDNRDERIASITAYAEWLMDRDRKAAGLKALQGHIWAEGYRQGSLRGDVFPDVPPALARWRAAGLSVAIFSSGSVLAQQLLFQTSTFGDLTSWIDAFFDLSVGPKTSPTSYRSIAEALRCLPSRVLFISDAATELDAAQAAGCAVVMCVRPGHPATSDGNFTTVRDFIEIE
jgi:enolase-phosphatase E1